MDKKNDISSLQKGHETKYSSAKSSFLEIIVIITLRSRYSILSWILLEKWVLLHEEVSYYIRHISMGISCRNLPRIYTLGKRTWSLGDSHLHLFSLWTLLTSTLCFRNSYIQSDDHFYTDSSGMWLSCFHIVAQRPAAGMKFIINAGGSALQFGQYTKRLFFFVHAIP